MEFSQAEKVYAQLSANVYAATNNDGDGRPRVRSELNALPLLGKDGRKYLSAQPTRDLWLKLTAMPIRVRSW